MTIVRFKRHNAVKYPKEKHVSTVVIKKCAEYDLKLVKTAIKEGLELIGGIGAFVKKDEKVLLKVNSLMPVLPETGIITHPVVIQAVIQLVKEQTKNIFVGDSGGFGSYAAAAQKAGTKKVCDDEGVEIIDFKPDKKIEVKERLAYTSFVIDSRVDEMDKIINLAKLKTHQLMYMTLCVKNMYGIIPGFKKVEYHATAGRDRYLFAKMLVDIFRTKTPVLNIVDGILGLEGNGPGTDGEAVKLGMIVMGADGFAIDRVIPTLVGVDPDKVYTNAVYKEDVLKGKAPEIEIKGEDPKSVYKKIKTPPDESMKPKGAFGALINIIKSHATAKPWFVKERCTGCKICVTHCPVIALEYKGKEKGVICDYDKCIRCFCCHEMCPDKAIDIRRGFLSFLFK
jgi:uncharacterized protein (DUF362 family)/Pyruvate/2-oxoacid:ferredoxin oxidoreductase delta subunit